MSWLYNVLIYLAAPFAILVQLWRGLRDPSYRGGLSERFGLGPAVAGEPLTKEPRLCEERLHRRTCSPAGRG